MTREQIVLSIFAALMSVAPYWFLPTRRRAFAIADVATWVALGGALASLPALKVWLPASLVLAIVVAAKLIHFFLWCALVPAEEVRWTPRAAALFALAIFLVAGTASLAYPVDGDEPYYVLMAESILHDGDLDLANQYAHLDGSVTKRPDLQPQLMDPVGPNGERYARHEPLLAILLIPGVASLGLWGAMATIALLGALAVGSMSALALEQGVSRAAALRAWPLVALGPPLLFHAIRIWPEAPAALCFSEAIRAAGKGKYARTAAWLIGLSLLQLRFIAVAAVFAILIVVTDRGARKLALAAAAAIAIPLLAGWLAAGNALTVHQWSELAPAPLWKYFRGGFGILFDAQAGMLFQAPMWFAAVVFGISSFSVLRSPFSAASLAASPRTGERPDVAPRRTENGERRTISLAAIATIPYLILLLPREEWHGGWSPPLRYLVVFAPLVAVGAGRLLERSRAWLAPAAIWTALLAIHGVAFPWRLFHIANGESRFGEWLSVRWGSDFSRLLPSAIRPNGALWAAGVLLVVTVIGAGLRRAMEGRQNMPDVDLSPLRGSDISGGSPDPGLKPGAVESAAAARPEAIAELPGAGAGAFTGAGEGRAGRPHHTVAALTASVAIMLFFAAGLRPGNVVHFEDAHVEHAQGMLDPEVWTVARFRFTGGWRLGEGESLRFRMRPGRAVMHVRAEHGGVFAIEGRPHAVPATGAGFIEVPVEVTEEKSSIRVIEGAMTFDRIERAR